MEYALKYQELLRDLKTTIEGLLASQVANLWSIYGGLNRLHRSVDRIFKHGWIVDDKKQLNESYINFIQGIEWLQPESSKSYFTIDCEFKPHLPVHLKNDKASTWLYNSLENHSLSTKLSWLLSDKSHLSTYYHPFAFLQQQSYAEAMLICIRAVERNQPSLMSDINPCLFLRKNSNLSCKTHRRCASLPDNQLKKLFEERQLKISEVLPENPQVGAQIKGRLRLWTSMPLLPQTTELSTRIMSCRTTPCTPIAKKKAVTITPMNFTRRKPVLIEHNIVEHTPPLSSSETRATPHLEEFLSKSPRSMMEYGFLPLSGEKDYKKHPKKSFIEDGGMSVLPMATGYFPKPTKGQSLLSFLQSSRFTRANAELDRENAHFSVSEAIISAMEQIRCKRDLKLVEENGYDSDPEISYLKQRIRLRRRQKLVESHRKNWSAILSDGKTDTTTSVSPCSSHSSPPASETSDDVEDLELGQASNLTDDGGLSMSMASLYSDSELRRSRGAPEGASDALSAEGVALSLISKFSEKQLPRASDLEWLVSEEDAPQALLPLPKSWPVSPDDSDEPVTPLRGTQEWAPPRAQLIFTLHPIPSRKLLMEKQNYRCAGCSMKVAPQYASKFRYCDYLGRYFCTGCHTNQLALIPGRVLQRWDFTRFPVSTFSYRLLERMYTDPLFRVFELNKNIMKMSRRLLICRRYRQGLYYLKDFIFTCRFAESIKEKLEQTLPSYVLTDPEVYSMDDLVNVGTGEMNLKLKGLVEICCNHTAECKLCLGRGFICEICDAKEIIFPWQMRIVSRCCRCGTCYHVKCWTNEAAPCPKCVRITRRREQTT